METHFLQSAAWEKFQSDLGRQFFRQKGENFEFLAILDTTPFGNYLFCPYGPSYSGKNGQKSAFSALKTLATEKNALFVRIEPTSPLTASEMANFGLKKSKDIDPAETWVLDLSGTDEDLKAKFPSRLCRYYRAHEKNGLKIETSKNPADIHFLTDLQMHLAKKKKIGTFSENYFKKQLEQDFATLYLVKKGKTVLAAGLVFDDPLSKTRFNLQGAQSEDGAREHATGILTIQLILDAKAKNLEIFDFWGIAPENAPKNHPWAGFTAFKKTFAGTEKKYAGTFDMPIDPLKYRTYKIFRALNRFFRKLK